jgi:hypothetical protein
MQRQMLVPAHLGDYFTEFTQLGGYVNILQPFIWSFVSGSMRFRDGPHKEKEPNFEQISNILGGETLEILT